MMDELLKVLWGIAINGVAAALFFVLVALWRKIQKEQRYAQIVTVVKAAELMFVGEGKGEEKLKWAIQELEKVIPGLDYQRIRPQIEEVVFDIKQGDLVYPEGIEDITVDFKGQP